MLVSFDGFRADYLERYPAPNFRRLAERGVRAESMIPVFPSKTFPSHYTIVTGLRADRHRLVGNTIYDPERDAWYRIGDRSAVEDSTWYGGEPLWVTAETQGMVAASYYWVGSEAAVGGVRPTFWYEFSEDVAGEARVERVLDWLRMPPERRPHLVTLYFSETDRAGHDHGPDSPQVAAAVARADSLLGRLARGVEALPHGDRIYLIVVSDHGMAGFGEADMIELETARLPGVLVAAAGPYASLFAPGAGPDELRATRDTVQTMVGRRADVYLRHEVPERLHYRSPRSVGDILVVPAGTGMVVPSERVPGFRPGYTHGWDNRLAEMGALFLAAGPELPADTVIAPFESIHIYPFVTRILGLEPAPVDGRVEVLGSLLGGRRVP